MVSDGAAKWQTIQVRIPNASECIPGKLKHTPLTQFSHDMCELLARSDWNNLESHIMHRTWETCSGHTWSIQIFWICSGHMLDMQWTYLETCMHYFLELQNMHALVCRIAACFWSHLSGLWCASDLFFFLSEVGQCLHFSYKNATFSFKHVPFLFER